jgi:hypothetical protein
VSSAADSGVRAGDDPAVGGLRELGYDQFRVMRAVPELTAEHLAQPVWLDGGEHRPRRDRIEIFRGVRSGELQEFARVRQLMATVSEPLCAVERPALRIPRVESAAKPRSTD